MQAHKPSKTAEWVAAARTLGQLLPRAERLAHDPYGIAFVNGSVRASAKAFLAHPPLFRALFHRIPSFRAFLWWMQLRTRVIDDVLREFIEGGGRQVVLLGAGYDCRALRFAQLLHGVRFLEVDHPNTQAHKRGVLDAGQLRSSARYVEWDFERQPLSALGARLAAQGLSPQERVLTIWEGVTMYLSEAAIADTFAAVRRFGATDSWLVFNYVDKRVLETPNGDQRITQLMAKRVGEPHRFGWDPRELAGWLTTQGYRGTFDRTDLALAQQYLPARAASHFASANRHIALASTLGV